MALCDSRRLQMIFTRNVRDLMVDIMHGSVPLYGLSSYIAESRFLEGPHRRQVGVLDKCMNDLDFRHPGEFRAGQLQQLRAVSQSPLRWAHINAQHSLARSVRV